MITFPLYINKAIPPILKTSVLIYTLVILAILYSNQTMSSSNTIVESVGFAVAVAAPVQAKVVQRKKKTVQVITKYEESSEVAQTTDAAAAEPTIAESLIGIMQTKPLIKTPNHKKKNATVADIVAPKVPKQNKKKNVESPLQVDGPVAENTLEVVSDVPIEVVAEASAPKVVKKRAPKKKAEVEVVAPAQTLGEEGVVSDVPIEVVAEASAPKVVKKRAPKKKAEVAVPVIVESNMDNIESLFDNMNLEEVAQIVVENTLEVAPVVPIEVVAEASAPKAPKKRAPKKKAEVEVVAPAQTLGEEGVVSDVPIEVVAEASAPKVVKKRAPKKKVEVVPTVIPTVIPESNMDNIESLFENMNLEEVAPIVAENTLEVAPVVPIEVAAEASAPKAPKKRAPKKKVEAEVVAPAQTLGEEGVVSDVPIEVVAEASAPKVVKKRAPKKKVEVVPTVIPESNMDNIESQETVSENTLEVGSQEVAPVVPIEVAAEASAPKAPKKRAPKKKAEVEVVATTQTLGEEGVVSDVHIEVVAEASAPKVVKKRAPKKKVEVVPTVIPEPNMDNIESQETVSENTLEVGSQEVASVVPIEVVAEASATKAPKKRAPKKKAEVAVPVIVESNMDNIESLFDNMNLEEVAPIVAENTLEEVATETETNGMEWFDEQAKQIQLRREPILATFAETPQELVEEMYEATVNHRNTHVNVIPIDDEDEVEDTEPYGNLQPIANIISETLENDDEYTEQIMVETFEFNGQTYWIDTENRVLDHETFEHIGNYDDTSAVLIYF